MVVARRRSVGYRSLVLGAAYFRAAMLAISMVPDVGLAYPLAALVGATSVAYMTATTAIAQLRAAPHMLGRVLALQTVLLVGTTPVGGPLLGALSDVAGGRAPMVVGGAGALAAAAFGVFGTRRYRAERKQQAGRGDARESDGESPAGYPAGQRASGG